MDESKTPFRDNNAEVVAGTLRFFARLLGSILLTYPVTGILVTTCFLLYGFISDPHSLEWENIGAYLMFLIFMAAFIPINGKLEAGGKPDYIIYFIEASIFLAIFFVLSGGWRWLKSNIGKNHG